MEFVRSGAGLLDGGLHLIARSLPWSAHGLLERIVASDAVARAARAAGVFTRATEFAGTYQDQALVCDQKNSGDGYLRHSSQAE